MGEFSNRIKNKLIADKNLANQKELDKLIGLYPMTYKILLDEINRVDLSLEMQFEDGTSVPLKDALKVFALQLKGDQDLMYKYYLEEVKPNI